MVPKKGPKKPTVLYHISDATGKLVTEEVGKSPFEQSQLSTDDCYIIDNGSNGAIYIWKGMNNNSYVIKCMFQSIMSNCIIL